MKPLRSLLLSVLILLQALVPYLHAHAAPASDRVMHLHLPMGALPGVAGTEAGVAGGGASRALAGLADGLASFDARPAAPWFTAEAGASCTAQTDVRAFGMPVEWLRDPPACAPPCLCSAAVRAPPAARPVELRMHPAPAPAARSFAVLVYPAAAPPQELAFR